MHCLWEETKTFFGKRKKALSAHQKEKKMKNREFEVGKIFFGGQFKQSQLEIIEMLKRYHDQNIPRLELIEMLYKLEQFGSDWQNVANILTAASVNSRDDADSLFNMIKNLFSHKTKDEFKDYIQERTGKPTKEISLTLSHANRL